jgi:hypothetical protein
MIDTQHAGFDISVEELDNNMLAVNFDKEGKAGGYISIKFEDDGVVVDAFAANGELLFSNWEFYNSFNPEVTCE